MADNCVQTTQGEGKELMGLRGKHSSEGVASVEGVEQSDVSPIPSQAG